MASAVVIVLAGVGLVLRTYEAIWRSSDDAGELERQRRWCEDEFKRERAARQRQALRRPDRGR